MFMIILILHFSKGDGGEAFDWKYNSMSECKHAEKLIRRRFEMALAKKDVITRCVPTTRHEE